MKRTKRKKSNRQVQLRWRWRCPWPAPLWLQNLLQVVYHVLYPYTYFCPSFFCFCAAYKRFLPVVVFVSPHFFRFFFLCIFVFICKISSLISVRVRLGPPCVCVCVCVDAWGVFYAIEMQPSISAAPPAPNLCVCCCCCCSQRATGFRCI